MSLTAEEIDALITNKVDSLARLAFAACPPGEAPTNEQIDGLFNGLVTLNPGTYASMKRLIFEAQTLLSADLQNKVHRTEDQTKAKLAPAERENRIKEQRNRLEGLRLKGEEECAYQSYAFFYEVDTALSLRNKVSPSFVAMCHFVQRDAYCDARECLGFLPASAFCARFVYCSNLFDFKLKLLTLQCPCHTTSFCCFNLCWLSCGFEISCR